jgi:hypothetical protein
MWFLGFTIVLEEEEQEAILVFILRSYFIPGTNVLCLDKPAANTRPLVCMMLADLVAHCM